jgi:FAD/FMN-containing dehydrogenase
MDRIMEHGVRCAALVAGFHAVKTSGIPIGLQKTTSNLFRRREQTARYKLDVRSFDGVLRVDPDRMIADVEGMTTYGALVDETLRYGLLPAVVPQLKTITVGGAVSGLGIESSSFKYGLVHETVEEMEIPDGQGVHRCVLPVQEPGSILWISELVWHSRLCFASHDPAGSSQAVRSSHACAVLGASRLLRASRPALRPRRS